MRTLLIVALLGGTLSAQKAPRIDVPLNAEWIGTLQWEDSSGEHIWPTSVQLKIVDRTIAGTWIGLHPSPPSGTIAGTIDKDGRWHLTVEVNGNGATRDVNGNVSEVTPERCNGTAQFSGTLFSTVVLRWTAKRIASDTDQTRLRKRNCEDPQNLTWLLQVRHQP